MFKRIMKILGIVLGGFVVIVGAFFGVTALTGGFEDKTVHLRKVYFDNDEANTKKEIYTLDNQTFTINYLPYDTTDKNLIVKVDDPVGVLDNAPETVVAGQPFTLNIRKDEKGNNIAGGVYLKIGRDQAWVEIYMRVDVAIPDNVLYFAGNTNDKITATGKKFTIARNNSEKTIYLKSSLVNAFNVSFENGQNIKSALIDYVYKDLDGNVIDTKTPEYFENLKTSFVRDKETNAVNYYFQIPIVPKESGTIQINAKMHRTYEIEQAYNTEKFDEFVDICRKSTVVTDKAKLQKFNAFLNKYMQYFNRTPASNAWFKQQHINSDGTVEIYTAESVVGALEYIFVSCSAEIEVTAVNMQKITSKQAVTQYNVFSTINFARTDSVLVGNTAAANIVDLYDVAMTLDNGEIVSNTNGESANLYDELSVDAYLYMQSSTEIENAIPVYGFLADNSVKATAQPITKRVWDALTIEEKDSYYKYFQKEQYDLQVNPDLTLNEDNIIGYLVPLKGNSQYNFIEVNPLKSTSGESYWQVNFNAPLVPPHDEEQIMKGLYLGFKVEGWDLKNNVQLIRETYSRVVINYTHYSIKDGQYLQLSSLDGDNNKIALKSKMALNSNLSPTSLGSEYANNQQIINIDFNSNVDNVADLQYTNIMYFAESTSNRTTTDDKKVFTVGKYGFVDMNDTAYMLGESQLIGERIPVANISGVQTGIKMPTIYGLNASNEPVKVFAVAYLSDRSGRPIDLNGKVINIDEVNEGEPYNIYVIAISNYSDSRADNIMIDSFVENINYYTKVSTSVDTAFKFGDYTLNIDSEYLKRNNVTSLTYTDAEGAEKVLSGDAFRDYQNFIALKLVQGMPLTVEVTNMNKGEASEKETIELDAIGINGKVLKFEPEQNVTNNKQIAFNNMCKYFDTDYEIHCDSNVEITDTEAIADAEGDYSAIRFKMSITKSAQEEDIDGRTGVLYIGPNVGLNDEYYGKLPFSETLISSAGANQVTYIKNMLKITGVGDVEYSDQRSVVRYNELLARYDASKHDGSLEFGVVSLNEDGNGSWSPYNLPDIASLQIGSVTTNLDPIAVDTNAGEVPRQYNYDIVDISQAMEDTGEEDSDKTIITKLIEDSISSNNLSLQFISPDRVAVLQSNVIFTNKTDAENDNSEEYIYIGSKKVYIGKENSSVTIANKTYEILHDVDADGNGYKYIEIEVANDRKTYFPIVEELVLDNGVYVNKQYVMMLDEKFEVVSRGENGLVISTTEATSVKNEIAVEITDKINNNNELLSNYIKTNYNSYNFIKGSQDGTDVFLILNIGFVKQSADSNDCKFNFQKLFTFNLKQNPVDLVGYNSFSDINSKSNPLYIEGGSTTDISLHNSGNGIYIQDRKIEEDKKDSDPNVFNHVKFECTENLVFLSGEGDSNESVTLTPGAIKERLKIKANVCGGEQDASIRLSYMYQGEVQTFVFYLKITANYTFTNNVDNGCSIADNVFKIELPAGKYNVFNDADSIISKYFVLKNPGDESSSITNVRLVGKGISGDELTIAPSFALQGNDNITKEKLSYQIVITVQLDEKPPVEITLLQTLSIVITPDAVLDANEVTRTDNLHTVLIGTNIFDYIKLTTADGEELSYYDNKALYSDIIIRFSDSYSAYSINDDGVIEGPITTENVTLTFEITYPNNYDNILNGSIIIEGVKMYLSTTGQYSQDNPEVNNSELFNNGSNINVDNENKLITIYLLSIPTEPVNVYKYIAIKGNTGANVLFAYVEQADLRKQEILSEMGYEYPLLYARQTPGGLVNIVNTGYSIRYVVVDMFYDVDGNISEETTAEMLDGKDFASLSTIENPGQASEKKVLNTLTIQVADGTEIKLNQYFKAFASDASVQVKLQQVGESSYVTQVTAGTVSSEMEYKVFIQCEEGDYLDTGYVVIIKIQIV